MAEDYSIRVRIDPQTTAGKDKVVSDFEAINQAADQAAKKAVNANGRIAQSYGQTAAASTRATQQTTAATTAAATANQRAAQQAANFGAATQAATTAGTTGLNRMLAATGLLGNSFGRIQNQLTNFNAAIVGFTGAVAGLAAVRTLSDFGDAIASVKAVTGATGKEFDKLRDTALDLGRTTRFSATESANALEELGRAGLDADQSLRTVPTVLKLAQAENIGLAESADIAAKSFRIFRTDVSDIPRLANQISSAATISATNVREIFNALKYGGPIAAGFKADSAEILAAFAVLSNSGQSASTAGTALRGILSRIAAPTKEFTKELTAIGVKFDEIDPKTHSLTEIFERLEKASVDTSEAFRLFKQRAGTGTEVLVNNIQQIKDLRTQIEAAGDVDLLGGKFNIKADTLKNDILLALGALQNFILTLGDAGLERAIRSVLQVFTGALNAISGLIRDLIPTIRIVGVALAVAFAPTVFALFEAAIFRLVFTALPALLALIYRIDTALVGLALRNPFTAVLVGITAIVAAFQQFGSDIRLVGTNYATVGDLFAVISDKIATGFGLVVNAAVTGFGQIAEAGATMANSVLSVFERLINAILSGLSNLKNAGTDLQNVFRDVLSLGNAAPLPRDPASQISLGRVEAPTFVKDFLKEVDNKALDRMAVDKAARAGQVSTLHDQALAAEKAAQAHEHLNRATDTGKAEKWATQAERMKQLLGEFNDPARAANANILALNTLFDKGQISASQYADGLQKIRTAMLSQDQTAGGGILRGLNQVASGAAQFGDHVEKFIVGAFNKASDAIANFATTGKLNMRDLVTSIISDLVKLSTNAVFGQLAQGLIGGAGASGNLFAGLFGGGIGGLSGFATGGSFDVGGSGSTDSQLVAFRATPGERVSVSTPQQQARSGGGQQIVNIYNPPGVQSRTQTRQGAGGAQMTDVVNSIVSEGMAAGRYDNPMAGRFANKPSTIPR